MKEILSSIIFLILAGGLLWGWNHWQESRKNNSNTQPSINMLAQESPSDTMQDQSLESQGQVQTDEEKKPDTPTNVVPKETLNVKVLNGGAVKGSAGKVQDLLKKAGYTKTQVGNSIGDYTGVIVYYMDSFESSAKAIQQVLIKDYPSAHIQTASSVAETKSTSVVVILGK